MDLYEIKIPKEQKQHTGGMKIPYCYIFSFVSDISL